MSLLKLNLKMKYGVGSPSVGLAPTYEIHLIIIETYIVICKKNIIFIFPIEFNHREKNI